jgi:hypothetical protein
MRKAILALLALALAVPAARAQGWAEKMVTGPLEHNFGTVARGAKLVRRVTITNIYAVPMDVTLKSGCGCVTVDGRSELRLSLKPRQSTVVEVRMDASRFIGAKSVGIRLSVGPQFISNALLKVMANSRGDVVFNPGEVNFGTVSRGQTPTQTVDVEYAGVLPWQVQEVVTRGAPFKADATLMYRRPGQVGYRLKVTLKPDAPSGRLSHVVFLRTNDPASGLVPVLVEANVQTALEVTPAALNLGAVKLNTPLVRRVVLRGNQPFRVVSVDGLGEAVTLGSPLSDTEAARQTVVFHCRFTSAGEAHRTFRIRTTLQDEPIVVTMDASVGP